jgi:hypothetical protein
MRTRSVPGFLPSRHGFRFANRWPPGPTVRFGPLDLRVLGIGDASAGLCGGMVTTVRDLFEAGVEPPPDTEPPAAGTARFRAIVRRQVESLAWLRVPLRHYDLGVFRPDPPTGLARIMGREPPRVVAVRDEWPRIRADLDAGRLPVLGLIRAAGWSPWTMARNHQVLAHAYEEDEASIRIRVYDPNHPGRDDVELWADVDRRPGRPLRSRVRLSQSTGEPLLGFFRQPRARPPGPRSLVLWVPGQRRVQGRGATARGRRGPTRRSRRRLPPCPSGRWAGGSPAR